MKVCFTILAFAAATTSSNAQIPDFTPPSPLSGAAMKNKLSEVRRLLEQGANPNEGRMIGFPPVFFAAMHQNTVAKDGR